jgi:predicted helicase
MSVVSQYISEVSEYFSDENSSEHSYRTAFQNYLATIFPPQDGYFIQQDAKAIDGNKPDYIILKNKVPLLYIEVKKVGENLDKIEQSNQADRYFGYTNLIISDYVEFRFFRNGQRYDDSISLGQIDVKNRSIAPQPEYGERLERTVKDFVASQKEPIKNGKHLAKIMGGKAQRIRDNVVAFLETESTDKDELIRMRRFIKEHLVDNFTDKDFADMYAQTLVYGLFAARYNDDTLETFSRQEARELVPATNPFLKSFFDHISGSSFPRRLELIVNELCEVFSHANVEELMNEYFKNTNLFGEDSETPDPVIHFYEDFLKEYDPSKKMEMGVFYTPLPVVRFIIRGIDELLKTEFGIAKGLSDNQKISVTKITENENGKKIKEVSDIHRVQMLDVATGTGTFLNETVNHIHESQKANQGRWPAYVQDDLLPRLHGFELMMASYTIAHLKLAMTLKKSGVDKFNKRLGVYLSNTLDDAHNIPLTSSLFGVVDSIAEESRLASEVKKDTPIMVIMGNPPYSGISQNKHYTSNDVYKYEPGGKQKLQERKHWLDDDYVKFIRFAESMVEKNSEGIVGMITAHGYIDNPTFRGMRWHLRKTFDKIYVLDLHGNSNKNETAEDGSEDKNVFDIKTGVSIIFGVKKKSDEINNNLSEVYQSDLYGKRAQKFSDLNSGSIESIEWNQIPEDSDIWRVEGEGRKEYEQGFSVSEMFPSNSTGIVTARDSVVIDMSREVLLNRINKFVESDSSESDLRNFMFPNKKEGKYKAGDTRGWKLMEARQKISHLDHSEQLKKIYYRPFDVRFCYYHPDMVDWGRFDLMSNFDFDENVSLMVCRQTVSDAWSHVNVTDQIVDDSFVSNKSKERGYCMPLYIYSGDGKKIPNLNSEIVDRFNKVVESSTPEDIFDYIYSYLYSPSYRIKYSEFLRSDFPRVPYPDNKNTFSKLVEYGKRLRQLHLLQHDDVHTAITAFPESGSDLVEKLTYENGKVRINETQYWDGVPKEVWEFYIGGYQPAQKYLKDRKGKKLTSSEFENYEKMIVSLNETIKVMKEIDKVI